MKASHGLLWVALSALPLAPLDAQEESPRVAVDAILEELDRHGDEDLAAGALAELGEEALGDMLDALLEARGPRKRSLLGAFAEAPVSQVRPVLAEALEAAPAPGPSVDLQIAALSLLGAVGKAADFDLCLEAARVQGEETYAPRTRELTETLDAIFERDPNLLPVVRQSWLHVEQRLRTPVARSVGNLGGDGALAFLTDLLERDANSAGMLLSQLGRASEGVSRETAEQTARVVRPYLGADRDGIVKEAAVTLARLEDDSAVPLLIPLLSQDSSRGVVGNAHWALGQLTGLSLPPDEAVWASWHAIEERWWIRDAQQAFRNLRDASSVVAGAAVREVSEHRLARHSLAGELVVALEHPVASVRQDAADALARLGSRTAVPALLYSMEQDADMLTRDKARRAVESLTGEDPLGGSEAVAFGD